jgi:hypothetical protein
LTGEEDKAVHPTERLMLHVAAMVGNSVSTNRPDGQVKL